MSTFMGLLSGGRPPARYETYWLAGLGADAETVTKKRGAPKKGVVRGKAKGAAKAKAEPKTAIKVKVKGGLRNAPLDRHHNPFKRDNIRPGVPHAEDSEFRQRETQRSDSWSCEWRPGTPEYTVQLCTALRQKRKDGSPKTKTIKVNRAYKKRYNKEYHKHLKTLGKPKFGNKEHGLYSFRETEWQKANPVKGRTKKPKKTPTPKKARAKKAAKA